MSEPASSSVVCYSTTSLQFVAFNGTDGEDVTLFIRDVKRIALTHGRLRDQEWVIDYVEACLGGHAMRWFNELDKGVLGSWDALRAAFLHRFKPLPNHYLPAAAPIRQGLYSRPRSAHFAPISGGVSSVVAPLR